MDDDIDVIINVVDASNLERNLYLTLQLLELGKPVVLADGAPPHEAEYPALRFLPPTPVPREYLPKMACH